MKSIIHSAAAVLVAAASVLANDAQVFDKKSLTGEGARRAIRAAVAEAKRLNTTGVIAVVDDGGNLMALERIDGTFAAGANISIGKARTSALFKKPSRVFEEIVVKGRTPMVALNDFTPLIGGVPITIDGQIVGAVGVSGAASAQQDEELALAGAAAVAGKNAEVTHFDAGKVRAAFDKGAVLYANGGQYMVHASHRDGAGMAEVHTEDADIMYVLDGTATVITGGEAVEAKTVGAGEIRGASIRNGDERQVKKGDVVIIPAGVPHWFKQVSSPFNYYVVKVR